MNLLDYHPSIFHDYHCPILRKSFPPLSYAPVQSDWSPSPSEVPSPTEYIRRTGWPVMTSTQSTSDEWNWCIPTSRVFETRIFVSSNFKKMRKYRFYWWSYFVYLFMIEVLNDFGLIKRIYVFSSRRDRVGTGYQSDRLPSRTGYSVGTGYQSDRLPSRTGYPVGLGTQSGLGTSRTGYPVGLGTQSDWVTGPTGTQSPSRGLELVHP